MENVLENMVEVTLKEPDDFLKVRETLTRIGVASRKDKTLYQSCHILHKQGRYYIVHFKELTNKTYNKVYIEIDKKNNLQKLSNLIKQKGSSKIEIHVSDQNKDYLS